jgi:hypothetical protein
VYSSAIADPVWLCLNSYLRCISYSQSPHTLHYASTVDSIFKCFLGTAHIFSFVLSLSIFLAHTCPHTYINTHAHIYMQEALTSCVFSQHSTSPLAAIPSKIVDSLHPLPPIVYCEHSSYNPTSISRHHQSPLECSQTTYQYQSNNKGEGEEDA